MTLAQTTTTTQPNRKQRRLAERRSRQQSLGAGGPEAILRQAKADHVAGRLEAAEAGYRRLLAAGSHQPSVLALLGALCLQSGRLPEAIELMEQARPGLPNEVSNHTNLGLAYTGLGDREKSNAAFERAFLLRPEDPEAQKNIAGWLHQSHRFAEAIPLLKAGLAKAPKDARRLHLLAQCHGNLNQAEAALEAAFEALGLLPADPHINAYLGILLAHAGRFEEAVMPILLGFPAMGRDQRFQATFLDVMRSTSYRRYIPEMEQALLTCFEHRHIDVQRLSSLTGAHIWLRYMSKVRTESADEGRKTKVHFDGLLADPLLINLLGKAVNKNLALESLLVPLRETLLSKLRQETRLSPDAMRFVVAFSIQCHHNSYIFPISEAERDALERLIAGTEARLSGDIAVDASLETELALCTMYRPLHRLRHFERLAAIPLERWSEALRPLIELSLVKPSREQALKPTIESFGDIQDSVSQAVRSQYEENPYPRWTILPAHRPASLARQRQFAMPWLEDAGPLEDPADCLIAGSGTGSHPINLAAMSPNVQFVAVDLSLSSLAYAKRMAELYGVENIEFRHGDLLQIDALGREFSWIESSGVLHHMENPEAGLASLLRILRPGGYLKLGLYSKTARRFIIEARERIQESAIEPTAENIRAFRNQIIAQHEANLGHFISLGDFFDLDSFRDLVFHVQEHQYTIPQLKDLLARHGLVFEGFIGLSPAVYMAFRQRFPDRSAIADMDCWDAFEADNPNSFVGMYEFWCRKPD